MRFLRRGMGFLRRILHPSLGALVALGSCANTRPAQTVTSDDVHLSMSIQRSTGYLNEMQHYLWLLDRGDQAALRKTLIEAQDAEVLFVCASLRNDPTFPANRAVVRDVMRRVGEYRSKNKSQARAGDEGPHNAPADEAKVADCIRWLGEESVDSGERRR